MSAYALLVVLAITVNRPDQQRRRRADRRPALGDRLELRTPRLPEVVALRFERSRTPLRRVQQLPGVAPVSTGPGSCRRNLRTRAIGKRKAPDASASSLVKHWSGGPVTCWPVHSARA